MGEGVLIALIGAIGLILSGVLVELIRSRKAAVGALDVSLRNQTELNDTLKQLNGTLHDVDRRLVAVETTVRFFHPPPPERRE